MLHLLRSDGKSGCVPVEVGFLVVGEAAKAGHVLALPVGEEMGPVVVEVHRLGDGEAVQFGGSEGATLGTLVFQDNTESHAADGTVCHQGVGRALHRLQGIFHHQSYHVVVVEHQEEGLGLEGI